MNYGTPFQRKGHGRAQIWSQVYLPDVFIPEPDEETSDQVLSAVAASPISEKISEGYCTDIYIYTFMCATILSYSIPKSNKWITWLYFKWSFWDGCGIKWLQYMRGFIKLRHVSTWAVGGADRQSCYVCNCVCVSLESNYTKLNPCLVQVRIFGEG